MGSRNVDLLLSPAVCPESAQRSQQRLSFRRGRSELHGDGNTYTDLLH